MKGNDRMSLVKVVDPEAEAKLPSHEQTPTLRAELEGDIDSRGIDASFTLLDKVGNSVMMQQHVFK